MTRSLVIPVAGSLYYLDLPIRHSGLDALQQAVEGYVEMIRLPRFVDPDGSAAAFINEEGKYTQPPNMRATDFMVPGVGLFWGDHIAGPMVLVGVDSTTGENVDVPQRVAERAYLIEREAG